MNLFDCVIDTKVGNIYGHARSTEGVAEVSEVRFDFPNVSRFLFCRKSYIDAFGIYIEEYHSFGNISWSICKEYHYSVCFSDVIPERHEQAIWRQRHNQVTWSVEDGGEHLREGAEEPILRLASSADTSYRSREEVLCFDVEVAEAEAEDVSEARTDG